MEHFETDMYRPVKELFENMGYKVNAEVKGCDVTAYKEHSGSDGDSASKQQNGLVVIELKKAFNLKLLYQGIERQRITKSVYLAIARPRKMSTADSRHMRQIVRRLGLGLIYVALDGGVATAEIILAPDDSVVTVRKSEKKQRAVTGEISNRKIETNIGGSSGVKLNTAYRERCIKIACIIEQRGEQSAKALMRDYGCGRDAYTIISACPYNWFTRVGRGIYGLTPTGRAFLDGSEFRTQIDYYRGLYKI